MSDIIYIENINDLDIWIEGLTHRHPLIEIINFSQAIISIPDQKVRIKSGLYTIMYKKHHIGDSFYGNEKLDFKESSVLCMRPEQVISFHSESMQIRPEGYMVFFHPELIKRHPLDQKIYDYTFFDYEVNEALFLSSKEREILVSVINKIDQELNANIDDFTEDLIVSHLGLLLNYLKRFYTRQFITRKNENLHVVIRFESFLLCYIQSGRLKRDGIPSVSYCAEQMNYSDHYLSDLLKKETGKTTHEHIFYQVFEKAKSLLLGSDMTINEIAYELGFDYPHYFSRLFKKKIGVNPSIYRKKG
jgi:AraC-like DNA-binding protein